MTVHLQDYTTVSVALSYYCSIDSHTPYLYTHLAGTAAAEGLKLAEAETETAVWCPDGLERGSSGRAAE